MRIGIIFLFSTLAATNIAFDSPSAALVISTATPGNPPDPDTFHSTYTFDSVGAVGNSDITGSIDTNMPTNTRLDVYLEAPSTGTPSTQQFTLSSQTLDLVTTIPTGVASDTFFYTVSLVPTGAVTEQTFNITLTCSIVDS
ncbi:MAG: hypothetical protein MRY21_02850 [Simkaniaceae bacterium]|nr:hypothetical protein [Simkaniaceae bacterium]